MKSIAVLALSLVAFIASTLSSTAQATSMVPKIAEYKVSSMGFRPGYYEITVWANGVVSSKTTKISTSGSPREVVSSIGQLSNSSMTILNRRVAKLLKAKMVDPAPEAPKCMDAPKVRYSVFSAGTEVEFAGVSYCHTLAPDDAALQTESAAMVNLLNGLETLRR